jgi:hypothetical protein
VRGVEPVGHRPAFRRLAQIEGEPAMC